MRELIDKYWWFLPNENTTQFKLDVVWPDNTSSSYVYAKSNGSWVPQGTHDSRLIISFVEDRFIVQAYIDDPFTTITDTYSNEATSVTNETIKLRKIHFPTNMSEFDISRIINLYVEDSHLGDFNAWSWFDNSQLKDIYLTNITENIALPDYTGTDSRFEGWCVIDDRLSANDQIYITNPDPIKSKGQIKSYWWRERPQDHTSNWRIITPRPPRLNEQGVYVEPEFNYYLEDLFAVDMPNGVYRMLPIGYYAGRKSFTSNYVIPS